MIYKGQKLNYKLKLKYFILFLSFILSNQISYSQEKIPFLKKSGNTTQLIVDNKPFIILGGELGNSSASTIENMTPIWPKLKLMNLNTVLIPVYWELIEKEEGKFDFKLIENLINEARNNNLKIVFLWFGSWKNSMSSHAPAWVKLNQKKYPRIKDNTNRSHEILTPFSKNNLNADLNAFKNLVQFIKDFDSDSHTTIMIQVENEIGMLPTARDYHPLANKAFEQDVPKELINYLKQHKKTLVPEFFEIWKKNGFKTSGNWEEIFGKGVQTDEIFMAWFYSKYTNEITEAGKKIYQLPMFVNAALNKPNKLPGEYPSAGPLPHLMDVWKAAGPAIDFLAPDFYNPNFKHWNDLYTRQGDPLFIPEHKFDNTAAGKAVFAIGHYEALGFSPFSIESVEDPENEALSKMYNIINQLSPIISANQGKGKIDGVLLDKESEGSIVVLGNYEFTFKHSYKLGWEAEAKNETWEMAGAIIIQTDDNEFYIAGNGIYVTFKNIKNPKLNVGILKVDEGIFENNTWKVIRHLNGDQTHQGRHLRIFKENYKIQRLKLYNYE